MCGLKDLTFISHMVQMKAFQYCSERINDSTLYPTWFRWKLVMSEHRFLHSHFISHMVQMKEYEFTIVFDLVADFISHMVQMKAFV